MGELVLDDFGRKAEPLMQDGPGHGPKSMAGNFGFRVEAQPLERGIDRRATHRLSAVPTRCH